MNTSPLCACGCKQPVSRRGSGWCKYVFGHQWAARRGITIDDETGCHLWQGALNSGGYGRFELPDGRKVLAHRHLYEQKHGTVPEAHDLHHRDTCPKRCVNDEHLTPLPHGEHSALTRSKLDPETRDHIATLLAAGNGNQSEVARLTGATRRHVAKVKAEMT